MATQIASLAVKLSANSARFTRGMGKARKSTAKFAQSAKAASLKVVALGAAVTVVGVKVAKLAMEQEKAEKALAASMRVVGDYSEAKLRGLKEYASGLQRITTYGDEALLSLMSLGMTMGKLSEQETKKATVAAIGLSKAFGVELLAAMRLVARARVGDTAQLKRYGIMIDNALSPMQKFNKLIEIGAKNFSLATAETGTAIGKLQQLGNTWGDVQEQLGRTVMNIPGLDKLMKLLDRAEKFLTAPVQMANVADYAGMPVKRRIAAMQADLEKTETAAWKAWMVELDPNEKHNWLAEWKAKQDRAASTARAGGLRKDIKWMQDMAKRGEEFPEVVAGRKARGLDRRKKAIASLADVYEKVARKYRDAMLKAEIALNKFRRIRWEELARLQTEKMRKAIEVREAQMQKWREGLNLAMPQHRTPAAAVAGTAGGWRAVLRAGDSKIRKQMDTLVSEQRKTREAIEKAHEDWVAAREAELRNS